MARLWGVFGQRRPAFRELSAMTLRRIPHSSRNRRPARTVSLG
ncbi:hypothetical protein ACFQU2_00590 [Siccirubricoccus deserti]